MKLNELSTKEKGKVVAFFGFFISAAFAPQFPPLLIITMPVILLGCYWWVTGKQRHWAYMLWGIIAPIGFLGICLLQNHSSEQKGSLPVPQAEHEQESNRISSTDNSEE